MKKATAVVHGGKFKNEKTGAISTPIYQSATFQHIGLNQSTGYDYSRTLNPTREALEEKIATLEGGAKGYAFSTGMAAVSAVLSLLKPGERILISEDLYGGTYRILEEVYRPYGIEAVYMDFQDLKAVREEAKKGIGAIFIESPTNPCMNVADIGALAQIAKEHEALTLVDNTFLTPYYQRPIELGADLVIHSATKYLGGHNDTLAGLVVARTEALGDRIGFIQNTVGAVLSPFDSWLILRGIKTLSVRLERSEKTALRLARWLSQHPLVDKVYYPGLPEHPGHLTHLKQASGFGSMLAFKLKEASGVKPLLEHLKLIIFAESLGGVESLITYPLTQTHAAIPPEVREKLGITDTLLRLSVGIEDPEDLQADLEQAFSHL